MSEKNPEFVIYAGPMFSGKTRALVHHLDRLQRQGKSVIAFKPVIDDRYALSEIVTHNGEEWPAAHVVSGDAILERLAKDESSYTVVAVDEAFMIPGVAKVLKWLYSKGVTVLVSTVDLSFQCRPFPEVEAMLPYATRIEKLTAICDVCPEEARYTYRKAEGSEQICVGGAELYASRCFKHHPFVSEVLGK